MLSSVRKNVLLSIVIAPFSFNCVFAQTPAGTTAEPSSMSNNVSTAMTNELFVNQWVHVDGAGSVKGSVVSLVGRDSVSLSKMRVSLSQNGSVVAFDDTDVDGDFDIEKVSPGLYSFSAEGAGSMAMFSLVVLDATAGQHLTNRLDVSVMPMSSRVSEILRGQSVPKTTLIAAPIEDPLRNDRKLASSHQVVLDSQGSLSGQLGKAAKAVDMRGMTAFIMKDGQELKRVKVAADGRFSVSGMVPGCYGLVAAGDQGVAVVGFCAVNRSVVSMKSDDKVFVAQSQMASGLNIELCEAPVSDVPMNTVVVDAVPANAIGPVGMTPGNGGGSFGGGGGSGGGIGGGIGALAGIGGLIAVGIIASDDNNDAPVASPIVP